MGFLTGTDLFNKSTPFIRYQVGDLAAIRRKDGHTQIVELMGRTNDLAILPSGRKIPGFSFYFVVLNVVDTLSNVKEFLFRQTSEGFNFEYVADKPLSNNDCLKIKNTIDLHFKENFKVTAVKVEKLERGKSGKFKQFISEVC
jgi:phenylacetate-CoA ligase